MAITLEKDLNGIEIVEDHYLSFEDILSYFDDLDFDKLTPVDTSSDIIKVSRFMAQAEFEIAQKEVLDKKGNVLYTKKATTPNDEKLSDTCIEIFQQSDWDKKLSYDDLREKALLMIEPQFKAAGLTLNQENLTNEQKLEITKRREIGISQTIRKIVSKTINTTIEYDFDEFINRTGIKSAKKLSYALQLLNEVQGKAFYQWKQPILSKDFKEVHYELVKVSQIPTIAIVLTEEGGQIFETFEDFVKSKERNKRKYIQGIRFDLNNSFIPYLIGLGKDYTKLFRKERNKFDSAYSFNLDKRLKSIINVQHIDSFNKFDFVQLQKIFGTKYTDYKNFKEFVLKPAIKDLNAHTNYDVELIEKRENNKPRGAFLYGRFRITAKVIKKDDKKFGVNPIAYYISSRLYYFSNAKINNIQAFARGIERDLKRNEEEGLLNLVIYGDKYINQWEEEAKKAIKIEKELLILLNNHGKFLKEHSIFYDQSRMCIMEEYIAYNDKEQQDIKDKRYITYVGNKITNPMQSLEYINHLVENEITHKANIFDFIPFEFFSSEGRVMIDNIKKYDRYQEEIKRLIVEKKFNHFVVPELTREIFNTNILRENFLQIDKDFKDLVRKLTDSN